ncbi:STAS domain-containing protein [Planotetraspora sp. A-T 1434]|uniref:STAS domain-containing protein n=1 Tax=Planotetraspora sp. A-T 1434 TaxID=2979219 RepID=UPI0021BE4D74|nr:STAS domain-containing protein [Planotetraspora sp. A-T 1434]MCT9934835.1 STAS domain-containing protein [Planotetraspora sp. A-T 1434]
MTTTNRLFEPASNPNVLYADRQLRVRSSGDGLLRLSGQIDLTNGDAVASALGRDHSDDGRVTVDVGELEFIDLYGLRTLALLSGDPLGRPVHLRNVQPALQRLLVLLAWPTFTIM